MKFQMRYRIDCRDVMKKLKRILWNKPQKPWLLLLLLSLVLLMTFGPFRLRSSREVKVIGYSCVKDCGGWADRQKGIVSAFVLAAMLGTKFKIHMPSPCEISYFLFPGQGQVDWRLRPAELDTADVTWVRKINSRAVDFAESLLSQDDLLDMFTTDYVFLNINMELVHILRKHRLAQRLPWLQEKTIPEIYRTVLTQLFSLMVGPQMMWDNFWSSVPPQVKLVCVQIRTGGAGDTESFNRVEHLKGLATFLTAYNSSASWAHYRFLFTSDKAFMQQRASQLFPALTVSLSGPITHVDRSTGSGVCGGMSRAIVEQLVLSKCHVLVMSESGFSKIASFLRGTDHNLFLFHDGLVEKMTRETVFPNRPSW